MKELLFHKKVDKSLLKAGMTIPKEFHEKLLTSIDVTLTKAFRC